MPIPDTVTQEDKDRWIASWTKFVESGRAAEMGVPAFLLEIENSKQLERRWFVGEWAGEQLRDLGATEDEVQDVCFNIGRRNVFAPDPWVSGVQAVDDYRAGIINRNIPEMISTEHAVIIATDGNRSE